MLDQCQDIFNIDANTVYVVGRIDLCDHEHMSGFTLAINKVIDSGAKEITLDFTKCPMLSSSIISLIFVGYEITSKCDIALNVKASVNHHRPLVSSGISNYVEVRLCS
ncbi:MAG: hypothetical protein JXR97_04560 [Planctomycetes bacterium]|nr:hypothetical protein [Planctomycetota bacterium]